eukprot:TRINITY_DN6748_c1_g1_i1.p3 TRINITY_DN6748_c1_g1~~TRINITY_DN6748_c1_g1_i1.p3  ORF type:complete len:103 (-),score=2.16 TRINITY_DN6748_c1_g1_i1:62-370(-)
MWGLLYLLGRCILSRLIVEPKINYKQLQTKQGVYFCAVGLDKRRKEIYFIVFILIFELLRNECTYDEVITVFRGLMVTLNRQVGFGIHCGVVVPVISNFLVG